MDEAPRDGAAGRFAGHGEDRGDADAACDEEEAAGGVVGVEFEVVAGALDAEGLAGPQLGVDVGGAAAGCGFLEDADAPVGGVGGVGAQGVLADVAAGVYVDVGAGGPGGEGVPSGWVSSMPRTPSASQVMRWTSRSSWGSCPVVVIAGCLLVRWRSRGA